MEERIRELRLRETGGVVSGHNPSNERRGNFDLKEDVVINQDEFGAIQALRRQGIKKKKAARILGIDPKTVRKYWKVGRWQKRKPQEKGSILDPWREHLGGRAPETDFCAKVCFLELQRMGYRGCYEQVKRFIRPLREQRRQWEEATIRFETGPGRQAQVDWGTRWVEMAGKATKIHLFVKVLGYSRRIYVRGELREDLATLIGCHEQGFEWFGGFTETILYDNPKTICLKRDFEGKDITWNPQFLDFSRYWGFQAKLCKPYRARTKGKVESGVKYVKRNFFGLYGRSFQSLEELNEKLERWALEVADERIHGTTHEKPSIRFQEERLISFQGKAPYRIEMDITRMIPSDAMVVFKTNRYSVPWTYVGQEAVLDECGERLKIYVQGNLVANHPLLGGRNQQHIDSRHYEGILKASRPKAAQEVLTRVSLWSDAREEVEVRDLESYEALAVGGAS